MYKKNMLQHYLAFISLLLMELNYGLWFSHSYFIFMPTYHCIPLLKENPLNNYFNWNSLISQSIYQPVRYSCWPIILNHLLQPWIRFTLDHTIILSVINLPTSQVLMYKYYWVVITMATGFPSLSSETQTHVHLHSLLLMRWVLFNHVVMNHFYKTNMVNVHLWSILPEEVRQDHVIPDGHFFFNTNCHSKIGNLL